MSEDITFKPSDELENEWLQAEARGSVGDDDDPKQNSSPITSPPAAKSPTKGRHNDITIHWKHAINNMIDRNYSIQVIGHKKPGTASGDRFAKYKFATNIKEFFWAGGTRADLKHDLVKGIIIVESTSDDDEEEDDDDDEPSHLSQPKKSDDDNHKPPPDDDDDDDDDEDRGEKKSDEEPDDADLPKLRRSSRESKPPPAHPPGTKHVDGGLKSLASAVSPPNVLKKHLTVDFSKMDKHFHEVVAGSDDHEMQEWKNAFQQEMDGVVDSGSLSIPTKLPKGKKAVKVRVIGKRKADGRKKWRMVPKGFMQVAGKDYDATHIDAPVVDKTIVRSLLAIGNRDGARMRICDVTQAFLNAELTEEVYMEAPPGIDLGHDDEGKPLVFRLLRAVYGLKQSPALWNDLIEENLAGEST